MAECNCNNCPLLSRVERLEQDMKHNSDTHSEMFHDINELKQGKAINFEKIGTTLEKVEKIEQKVDQLVLQLSSAPAKNWDAVVKSSIAAVVGALVGSFMTLIIK